MSQIHSGHNDGWNLAKDVWRQSQMAFRIGCLTADLCYLCFPHSTKDTPKSSNRLLMRAGSLNTQKVDGNKLNGKYNLTQLPGIMSLHQYSRKSIQPGYSNEHPQSQNREPKSIQGEVKEASVKYIRRV
ncbi:hypothetical protein PCH_Pc09g00090 [Penicillium rubens Wisconsin 54-1255]|uniref:Uncharacterized protein n=1 Tax=Penicillium rubens (strain ATCC 28089 / DSM 1075 / NRRL 1951 / Wisconsin 54-1255) TaxID=500485 RepID=B6GWK6_PENRW|nr:hypothetical protein PCH_Pc09g00090 [Penicillium rubens Wisconsin 54-1255]